MKKFSSIKGRNIILYGKIRQGFVQANLVSLGGCLKIQWNVKSHKWTEMWKLDARKKKVDGRRALSVNLDARDPEEMPTCCLTSYKIVTKNQIEIQSKINEKKKKKNEFLTDNLYTFIYSLIYLKKRKTSKISKSGSWYFSPAFRCHLPVPSLYSSSQVKHCDLCFRLFSEAPGLGPRT